MKKQTAQSAPIVGGSSLLVVFTVLCLTVFALLALSTAQSNGRLSTAGEDTVTAYYRADYLAEQILADLRAGHVPEGVTAEDSTYSYYCQIDDSQMLSVQVEVTGSDYRILRWQEISTIDWKADESITVWDGEIEE